MPAKWLGRSFARDDARCLEVELLAFVPPAHLGATSGATTKSDRAMRRDACHQRAIASSSSRRKCQLWNCLLDRGAYGINSERPTACSAARFSASAGIKVGRQFGAAVICKTKPEDRTDQPAEC